MARKQVLISGYYGFDNLGDEAILEELVSELGEFFDSQDIVVLSNNPQQTAAKFAVSSINRWKLGEIAGALSRSKLFISGGGGLFQDSHSAGSVVYYGGLILLARILGARTLVYAQGVGPLRRKISRVLTAFFFKLANAVSVRDDKSIELLKSWHIKAEQTADPVWALSPRAIDKNLQDQVDQIKTDGHLLVGLSLRNGTSFGEKHIEALAETMHAQLPAHSTVLFLPLQDDQDREPLGQFKTKWQSLGRQALELDLTSLKLPGQWLSLIAKLDCLVGMRLHSLIMALASGVPVLGIAYDPKVENVLREFNQPSLPFAHSLDQDAPGWPALLKAFLQEQVSLAEQARIKAQHSRQEACKNRELIAKILAN